MESLCKETIDFNFRMLQNSMKKSYTKRKLIVTGKYIQSHDCHVTIIQDRFQNHVESSVFRGTKKWSSCNCFQRSICIKTLQNQPSKRHISSYPPYLLSSSLSSSQALPWALLPDLPLPLALLLSPLVPPPAGVIPPTSLTQR